MRGGFSDWRRARYPSDDARIRDAEVVAVEQVSSVCCLASVMSTSQRNSDIVATGSDGPWLRCLECDDTI